MGLPSSHNGLRASCGPDYTPVGATVTAHAARAVPLAWWWDEVVAKGLTLRPCQPKCRTAGSIMWRGLLANADISA
jgi:hypothetical protein